MLYRVDLSLSYFLESDKHKVEIEAEEHSKFNPPNLISKKLKIILLKEKKPKPKIVLGEFSVEEVLPFITKENKKVIYTVDGKDYEVKMNSSRYFVFKDNIKCCACGLEGAKFYLEKIESDKRPHFNLYAFENGKPVLMTKDHICPISKGGNDNHSNFQTYCSLCNNLKGDNDKLTNQEVKELRYLHDSNINLSRKQLSKLLDAYKNRLTITHKELLLEWDYDKNQNIQPSDFSYGSNKIVNWKCKKGHQWATTIASRAMLNHGCPYCNNRKIDKTNCLALLCPELMSEWSEKNTVDPYTIGKGCTKKVWWKCSVCQYEWKAQVSYRTGVTTIKPTGCPNCVGMVANKDNCAATLCPELVKEWHPKNKVSLEKVLPYSSKKMWWIGTCGHEWESKVSTRTQGAGCPFCRESRGEKAIKSYLDSKGLNYEQQHRFEKCRDKYKLPFDFAVFIDNKIALIEYNGEQHFTPIEVFGGEKVYKGIIRRDNIKKEFCSQAKIPLLVIPYSKMNNIEKLLDEFLLEVKGQP